MVEPFPQVGVKNGENKKYVKPRLVMDFRSLLFLHLFTRISANSIEQLECLELRVSSTIEEHFSPGLKNIGDRGEIILEALTGSLPSFITTSGLAKKFNTYL